MQSTIQPIYYQRQVLNGQLNSISNTNNQHHNLKVHNLVQNVQTLNQPMSNNLKDNPKTKSSMCLINELSRSCKIEHKYILEDEKGPAHKKIFTIRLKLGDEEYVAEDTSIKKAQHAAASAAFDATKYKTQLKSNGQEFSPSITKCITPTVELNGLVMKQGQPVVYTIIEKPKQYFYPRIDCPSNYPKHPKKLFTVKLNVGARQYLGQGSTVKAARNYAAEQALEELANMPHNPQKTDEVVKNESNKSVLMQVHEIVHKRKMPIKFELLRETGPSHLRIYVIQCSSGDLMAEGEGRSKKIAKNKAAENLLPLLLNLPPIDPSMAGEKPKRLIKQRRKKINKTLSLNPEYGSNMNPSSRLIQIQQAKMETPPVFEFLEPLSIDTDSSKKNKGFICQVSVGEKICQATGRSKKLAKRLAAEEMLKLLGYYPTPTIPSKPALKISENKSQLGKSQDVKVSFSSTEILSGKNEDRKPAAKYVLKQETEVTSQNQYIFKLDPAKIGRYKNALMAICGKFDIKYNFSEMPKRPNTNYLTLLSLATEPQLHSHGEGSTREESIERSCHNALQSLSENGIRVDEFL